MRRFAMLVVVSLVPLVARASDDLPTNDWVGCYQMQWPDGSVRFWGYLHFAIDEDGSITGRGDLTNNPQTGSCAGYWTSEIKSGWFHPDGRPYWFMDMSDHDDNLFLMALTSDFDGKSWALDYWLTGLPSGPGHVDLIPGTPLLKEDVYPEGTNFKLEPAPEVLYPDSCRPPDVADYCPTRCADPPGCQIPAP